MKKGHLFMVSCSLLVGLQLSAQEERTVTFICDEEIPGIVQGVSGNGEWAAGCDEGVMAYNAFIWHVGQEKFTDVFGLDESGNMVNGASAYLYGIADDGTAVGAFQNGPAVEEGRTPPIVPGVYKDGQWTALPLLIEPFPGDVNGYATGISPDGRIICGHVAGSVASSEFLGDTLTTAGPKVPVLWIDGEIHRVDTITYAGYGAWVEDMSDDGSVLCGYADFEDGSRSPAVFKDGHCIRLIGTTSAMEDPDKWQEFYEGRMYCLNSEGTIAGGYFAQTAGAVDGIVWDIPATITSDAVEDDEVEHVSGIPTAIDGDGAIFVGGAMGGSSSVFVDGASQSLSTYLGYSGAPHTPSAIMGISDDMDTYGTSFIYSTQMGPIQCPMIITFKENTSGLSDTAANVTLSYADNVVTIGGNHGNVTVWSVNGTLAMQGDASTETLSLNSLPKGIYLVKAMFDGGFKVLKVVVK
ncbi:MAG TPA: T9SS type A sorting domain-containing protein [Candidatus Avibacteroides avistercoris]|uniref:T9SS type A sorting domain-containing protein n=1 Tax=Candidatus Avibacteroides avistercoris TaxID=2840690 RepID=A0A9D2UIW4_9BACT|nr:T9SS type A sorting domain-containing protein [Candidatus Avibacteroides avistercoris]